MQLCILLAWLKSVGFLLDLEDGVAYILIAKSDGFHRDEFIQNPFLKQNFGDFNMANGVTLRSVERLAQKLPPTQQLELISRLSQRLSMGSTQIVSVPPQKTKQQIEEERRVRADKLLAEAEAVAHKFSGKSNVVAEIRRMRKPRDRQIWKNVLTPM
jgi:hypothetical protein